MTANLRIESGEGIPVGPETDKTRQLNRAAIDSLVAELGQSPRDRSDLLRQVKDETIFIMPSDMLPRRIRQHRTPRVRRGPILPKS